MTETHTRETNTQRQPSSTPAGEPPDWVLEKEDQIREAAESGLPDAYIFQGLVDAYLDPEDESGGSSA